MPERDIEYILTFYRVSDDAIVPKGGHIRQVDGKKYAVFFGGTWDFSQEYGSLAEELGKKVITTERLTDENVEVSIKIIKK